MLIRLSCHCIVSVYYVIRNIIGLRGGIQNGWVSHTDCIIRIV